MCFIIFCGIFVFACSNREEQLTQQYDQYTSWMEKNIYEKVPDSADQLMYDFVQVYPKSKNAAKYFFYAAKLKSYKGELYQSGLWLEQVFRKYPESEFAKLALNGAIVNFSNAKNGASKHKELMQAYIQTYPNDPLTPTYKKVISENRAELSPEEELRQLLEKQSEKKTP